VVTPSENLEGARALIDGDPASEWSTRGPMRGGEQITVSCRQPVAFGRIEIDHGAVTRHGPEVQVVDANGRVLRAVPLRPPVDEQLGQRAHGSARPLGDVYVLAGRPLTTITLRQAGQRPDPWRIRELRVLERTAGVD
jgi:hypothetical protein